MVSKDEITENNLTTDDVLDRETVGPHNSPTEAHIPEFWEDCPEEAAGDEHWMEENDDGEPVLCWRNGEFEARLTCLGFSDWKATVSIPDEAGRYHFQEHSLKAHHPVMIGEHPIGYVDEVRYDESNYVADEVVLRIAEAEGQPTFEVENWIEGLRESTESSKEFEEELSAKLDAARENEA